MIRPRICSHLAVMKQTVVLGHQWVYSATGFCLLPLRTWICVTVTVRSHLLLKVKHLLCHCLNRSHPWTTELTRNTRLTCGRDGQPSGQGTKAAQLTISVLSVCFAFSVYKEKTHRCWDGVGCGITRPGSPLTRIPCVTFDSHVTSVFLLGQFLPSGTGVEVASGADPLRKTQCLR